MQLYLCEKPSQAKDIARVLGVTRRGQGFIGDGNTVVTWAIGHLLEQADPESYGEQFGKPWRADVLPVQPDRWKMVVKPQTRDQFTAISKLLKQASEVVIATDADREGEVIARELLEYCQYRGSVRRLWLSALDEVSIREALANILPGEKTARLYDAGKGRSQADWLIGMNLTRLYTLKARDAGVSEVLSVGRVQTPTLAMVVNRDNEIARFVPVPWWQVQASLEKDGVRFRATWAPVAQYCDDEKRCINKQAAQAVVQLCQQHKSAAVLEVSQKREKTPAPLCFDLGTLQQVCSQKFGLGAQKVLSIAQSLYETHKATTYPRTDCGYLPASMQQEIPEVLSAVAKSDPSVAPVLAQLDRGFVSRVWNDKKITAHHAIIPNRQAFDISRLSDDELKVYQLIRLHYLAQFLPLQESDVTDASFSIGGQLFRVRGKVNVVTGWKSLFQAEKPEDGAEGEEAQSLLPPLSNGDSCIRYAAKIISKQLPTLRNQIQNNEQVLGEDDVPRNMQGQPDAVRIWSIEVALSSEEGKQLYDPILDGLRSAVRYDRTYFDKIVASLLPLLEKLTTGKTAELLAPDYLDMSDSRPIFDWEQVIRKKAVVYIGLDALSDSEVASAVGNSMFADLVSVAGHIYKHGITTGLPGAREEKTPVNLHCDEFNELMGDEFIPLINKGGGAGMQVTAYTQTSSDIEARIGNAAKTAQVQGNFNNLIMLRVRENRTAELLTTQLPQVEIYTKTLVSGHQDTADISAGQDFTSSTQDRVGTVKVPLLEPADIVTLPKGQAFALLEGGQLWKIRMPLPAGDADDVLMPESIEKIAEAMRRNYHSGEGWWNDAPVAGLNGGDHG